jgi:signal transduction histidine kinase
MVLGLIETARVVSNPAASGVTSMPWDFALLGNFPWWFSWALLTPIVFTLADRFRLDEPGWLRRLPVHLVAGTALIAVHLPMALFFWYYTNPVPSVRLRGFGTMLGRTGATFLLLEVLTLGAAIGLFYALDNHRRLHFRQLESTRLVARASALEASAASARLEALRMELGPHFLFNALNSVSGLIRSQEPGTAVQVLSRLGDLLRISLGRDLAQQVTLAQEIRNLDLYLDIERARFRDRLSVSMVMAPETLGCMVPVLCLQPLVENAIKHGVSKRPGAARILLHSTLDTDRDDLLIRIEDDGPGFLPSAERTSGIGLSNTRARLAQLYGDAGRLEVVSEPGKGAVVTLRLPVVSHPEAAPAGLAS